MIKKYPHPLYGISVGGACVVSGNREGFQVDITSPIKGTPQLLDVDNIDFEIHVLSLQGSGKPRVNVLRYVP